MSIPIIKLPNPKVKGYATLSLYVATSIIDEPPELAGINHLLEHVLACNDNIDKEIASKGLEQNAETHNNYVRYWFSTSPQHFNFCLAFLKKISSNPSFEHVEREAKAVRQELISLLQETDYYSELAASEALFPNSGLSRGNNAETMLKILPLLKKDTLQKYYNENYKGRMFIVISGGPHSASKSWSKQKTINITSNIPKMVCHIPKSVIHVKRPEIQKSICKLVYYNQPTEYPHKIRERISLATRILSGGLDSLLYKILRDKLNLVYSVSCSSGIEPYGVIIEIDWSCDTKKVKKSIEEIQKVIKNFTALHFNGHKNLILEQIVRETSLTSQDIVELYGDRLVTWGEYKEIPEISKSIKKIKPSDVVSSVKTFLNPERCFLVHMSKNTEAPLNKF